MHLRNSPTLTLMVFILAGCGEPEFRAQQFQKSQQAFSSDKATLFNFSFRGELVASTTYNLRDKIERQLLYTVGQLNGDNTVGRLDTASIENIQTSSVGNRRYRVTYDAVLPVGWTQRYNEPTTYRFVLPQDFTYGGESRFLRAYSATCVDLWSAHDLSTSNYWYYYRPEASGCAFADGDVVATEATVTLSDRNSHGTYPELDKVWEDNVLEAVVIFGRDKPGSTGYGDFGIAAYGQFNYRLRWAGYGVDLQPTPADIPQAPGSEHPDVTWRGTFPEGRQMVVTALLIDNPQAYNPTFDARYNALSATADVIIYNGHAGLGANVRALSRKGTVRQGQYTIVSMMGCDTFAYVDGYMAQQRAAVNPDDPTGTKYLDMITNVVPTNPTVLPTASLELIRGLSDPARPRTYVDILRQFERTHFAVVSGDEDNSFRPE